MPKIGQVELRKEEKCTLGDYVQANGKCQACQLGITPTSRMQVNVSRAWLVPCNHTKANPNASRARTGGIKAQTGSNIAKRVLGREQTRPDANYKVAISIGQSLGPSMGGNGPRTPPIKSSRTRTKNAKDAMNNTLTSGASAVNAVKKIQRRRLAGCQRCGRRRKTALRKRRRAIL